MKTEDDEMGELKVLAFRHTYDFAFTLSPRNPGNGDVDVTEAYRKEVEVLKKTLFLCSQSSIISDRGGVASRCYGRRGGSGSQKA